MSFQLTLSVICGQMGSRQNYGFVGIPEFLAKFREGRAGSNPAPPGNRWVPISLFVRRTLIGPNVVGYLVRFIFGHRAQAGGRPQGLRRVAGLVIAYEARGRGFESRLRLQLSLFDLRLGEPEIAKAAGVARWQSTLIPSLSLIRGIFLTAWAART
jgi:hypothetical protein